MIEKRMVENLITKLDDTSWQKEFLEMKSHSTSDVRLLMQGAKGFREAWHLGLGFDTSSNGSNTFILDLSLFIRVNYAKNIKKTRHMDW